MLTRSFFWQPKLNFDKTTGHVSSINVSVDVFLLLNCYSTVQLCVWFVVTETRHAERVHKCELVRNVLINTHDSFQKNLIYRCYDGRNQQICISKTYLNTNIPGIYLRTGNFMDRYGHMWKWSDFSTKTNLLLSKTAVVH